MPTLDEMFAYLDKNLPTDPILRRQRLERAIAHRREVESESLGRDVFSRFSGTATFGGVPRIVDYLSGTKGEEIWPGQTSFPGKALEFGGDIAGFLTGPSRAMGAILGPAVKGLGTWEAIKSTAGREALSGVGYGTLTSLISPEPSLGKTIKGAVLEGALWGGIGGVGTAVGRGTGAIYRGLKGWAKDKIATDLIKEAGKAVPKEVAALRDAPVKAARETLEGVTDVLPGLRTPLTEPPRYLTDAAGQMEINPAWLQFKRGVGEEQKRVLSVAAQRTVLEAGQETTLFALHPGRLLKRETDDVLRFVGLLDDLSRTNPNGLSAVDDLLNIRLAQTEAKGVEQHILRTRKYLVEKKLSELGLGPEPKPFLSKELQNVLMRKTRIRGETPELLTKYRQAMEALNPLPEGSLAKAKLKYPEVVVPVAPEVHTTRVVANVERPTHPVTVSALQRVSMGDVSKIEDAELRAAVIDSMNRERQLIAQLAKSPEEAKALAERGLAAKIDITKNPELAWEALFQHRALGLRDPELEAWALRQVAEGKSVPEKIAKWFPDLLKQTQIVQPVDALRSKVLVKTKLGTQIQTLNAEQLTAASKIQKGMPGSIVRYYEAEQATRILGDDTVKQVITASGLEELPSRAKQYWESTKLGIAKAIYPNMRIAEAWKVPQLAKAIESLGIEQRLKHNDVAKLSLDIGMALQSLTAKEADEVVRRLLLQEQSLTSLFKAGASKVDDFALLIQKYQSANLDVQGQRFLLRNGYYAKETSEATRVKLTEVLAKQREKVQYYLPHNWEDKKYVYNVLDKEGNVFRRFSANTEKEKLEMLTRIKREFVGQGLSRYNVLLDLALDGTPLLDGPYQMGDYIATYGFNRATKTFKVLPTYDEVFRLLSRTHNLPADVRAEMLEAAARGSGAFKMAERKWVGGFETDTKKMLLSIARSYEDSAHQFAAEKTKIAFAEALQAAPVELKAYVENLGTAVLTHSPDYTSTVRSLLYTTMMGGNAKFVIQQFSQNLIYAPAHFMKANPGSTTGEITSALLYGMKNQWKATNKLPARQAFAIRKLEKLGILDAEIFTENKIKGLVATLEKGPMTEVARWLRFFASKTEAWNRRNTALQSLQLNLKKGIGVDEAVALAHRDVLAINHFFGRENRPLWILKGGKMEPLYAMVWMFKTFPANTLAQMVQVYTHGGTRARLMQTVALLGAGGAAGLPFTGVAGSIRKWMKPGADPEGNFRNTLYAWQEEIWKEAGFSEADAKRASLAGADLITYGIPGLLGINASTTFGLQDLPPSHFEDIAGVTRSVPMQLIRGYKLATKGQYQEALESFLPLRQASRISQAIRWMDEGIAKDGNGIPLLGADGKPLKVGSTDVAMTVLGMPKIAQTRYWQQKEAQIQFNEANRKEQSNIYDKAARALVAQDLDDFRKIQEGVIKWNTEITRRKLAGEDVSDVAYRNFDLNAIRNRVQTFLQGRQPRGVNEQRFVQGQRAREAGGVR